MMRISAHDAFLAGIVLLALSTAAPVTSLPQSLPAAAIAGQVVRWDTGAPLGGASIALRPMDGSPPYRVRTLADGAFALSGLPPGQYRLEVSHSGFLDAEYGQRRIGGEGLVLTLPPGQQVSQVRVAIPPAAAISGRVYGADGAPVVAEVQALAPTYRNGQRELRVLRTAISNNNGGYRLYGLPPGPYYVAAIPAAAGATISQVVVDGSALESVGTRVTNITSTTAPPGDYANVYAPIYYPGAADIRQAAAVEAGLGAEIAGVDFRAGPIAAVRVSGYLPGESHGQVSLTTLATPSALHIRNVNVTNGEFTIPGVTPGLYLLEGIAPGLKGRMVVDVADRDVNGIVLPLAAATRIPGRIVVEGAGAVSVGDIGYSFAVVSEPATPGVAPDSYRPLADGSFQLNLFPGSYRIQLSVGAPLRYIRSIRMGDIDVLNGGLQSPFPGGSIEIVVSANPATVEGAVHDGSGQPVPNGIVVLVPEAARRSRPGAYAVAHTDLSGRFQMPAVPAGAYLALAWEDVEPGAWMDPRFISSYEPSATPVRVEDGERIAIELPVTEYRIP